MSYIENPKTKDSGIICCIPQTGRCPYNCEDCFFQSDRSYLEPLDENLPNMPSLEYAKNKIVRVNDGNDSSVNRDKVIEMTKDYPNKFYNTSKPQDLDKFPGPVVLTLNPGKHTDGRVFLIEPPNNLMFVRVRTNMWNINLVDEAVQWYTDKKVPIVLTFMAYFNKSIEEGFEDWYIFRKRTSNSYWAITTDGWERIMDQFKYNKFVHSCGKIEGEKGDTKCKYCGNCLREYYSTIERINS